jgi:light-regulated signal transduction histidine kinase (bacteriophytochrome)
MPFDDAQELLLLRSQINTLEQLLQVREATALQQALRLEKTIERLQDKTAEVEELNRELENRVLQRTSELQAAVQELETFCYSVSHDLRAPLRTLDGFSQALLEDYGETLDADGRMFLDRIRKNSQHLAQLIDSLLQLSRLNRLEMKTQAVDLSQMVAAVISDLKQAQPRPEMAVHIEPGIQAEGDSSLLQNVLMNLLENSWKFTAKTEHPTVEFGLQKDGSETCCFVRDNGAGFDMRFEGKLFGAFQRLHRPGEFEGTGIGLATVQRIIRRHRGRIWARAAVNEGATFYFTLPGLRQTAMEGRA